MDKNCCTSFIHSFVHSFIPERVREGGACYLLTSLCHMDVWMCACLVPEIKVRAGRGAQGQRDLTTEQ